ncbi:MAG: sulfite exporter TauE/SafE family protein [Candidatus Wildermuthbacteria bacterium]|nr:sulfite exporter TauE/SafE family protein [Candidatus Wildermuthbacteria bacterium]
MEPISFAFIFSAFVAGIVTFFAPCTMPLVPGYLSFISGASVAELQNPKRATRARAKIFFNGVLYVIGFSAVFILFGSLFGLGGSIFFPYRTLLIKLGGIFVVLFGIVLLIPAVTGVTNGKINFLRISFLRFLAAERQVRAANKFIPGKPISSLLFGGAFALGWSPCVGPILGVILTLAASSATVGQGAFLLFVFSLGLATPFLLTALAIGWASTYFGKIARYLNWISLFGGGFLVLLGIMMVTNNFLFWIAWIYGFFDFFGINYEGVLLDLL